MKWKKTGWDGNKTFSMCIPFKYVCKPHEYFNFSKENNFF